MKSAKADSGNSITIAKERVMMPRRCRAAGALAILRRPFCKWLSYEGLALRNWNLEMRSTRPEGGADRVSADVSRRVTQAVWRVSDYGPTNSLAQ